jgi:hypothetical protein
MVAALWVVSIVVTYLVASSKSDDVVTISTGKVFERQAKQLPEDAPAAKSDSAAEVVAPAERAELEVSALDIAEIYANLESALRSNDLVGRNAAIARILSGLTPENVHEALRVFENTPRSYHTDNNFRLFLHAWAKIDGRAALAYIRENPDAHRVGDGVNWAMSGWGQSDPDSALDYVLSQKRVDPALYHGLMRGWARGDLDAAKAYVAGVENDGLRRHMLSALGESYIEQHGASGVLAWADEISRTSDDEGFVRAVVEDVMKRSATHNSAEVAQWIDEHADNPHLRSWVFAHTAGNLARQDPELAAEWVESHMTDERIDAKVIGRVVGEWARHNPADAAAWIGEHGESDLFNSEVISDLAGNWARRDSGAALDWAANLDPDARKRAYGAIVGRVSDREFESTANWLRDSPVSEVMDSAREAYAWRTFRRDPPAALAQAGRIANVRHRESMSVRLAHAVLRQDRAAVVAWLPNSGLSPEAQRRILPKR